MVSFPDAVKLFFRRYTDFQGRSSRSEYWWVALFNILALIIPLIWLSTSIGGDLEAVESGSIPPGAMIPIFLMAIFFLAILIPSIALAVRRFHDLNQTGWLYLVFIIVGLIPLIGSLASLGMIIWFCFPGTSGHNKYGPDPLDPSADVNLFN